MRAQNRGPGARTSIDPVHLSLLPCGPVLFLCALCPFASIHATCMIEQEMRTGWKKGQRQRQARRCRGTTTHTKRRPLLFPLFSFLSCLSFRFLSFFTRFPFSHCPHRPSLSSLLVHLHTFIPSQSLHIRTLPPFLETYSFSSHCFSPEFPLAHFLLTFFVHSPLLLVPSI